jgi:hypothetical protein
MVFLSLRRNVSTSILLKSFYTFTYLPYGRYDRSHVTIEKGFGLGELRKPARIHFSGVIFKLRDPRSESLECYGR